MNKITLNLLVMFAVIVAICLAGRVDYNDEIIYHMSNGTYEVLKEKLGNVSTSELVDAYMEDRAYWDSLGKMR